jgi:hypothetical protein
MSGELKYSGRVTEQGEIILPAKLRAEVAARLKGKQIEAIFRKKKKTRSSEQNRYYWGVVVRIVAEGFADLGNPISPSSEDDLHTVHEYLKRRFLKPITAADANGEVHELGYSTANLSTSEMMDYIAQVQQFAAEFLNVAIPAPGEQAEINF